MARKISSYAELIQNSREQIIQIASLEIKRVLADIDLSHYRYVQVWKTSKHVRVIFDANISVVKQQVYNESQPHLRSPGIGSSITFISNERMDEVQPKDSKFLFKYTKDILVIAKKFNSRDSLSFEDMGDSFRVRASHPSTKKSSGGFEVYLINKKTLERKMIQHAHPRLFGNDGVITDRFGNLYNDPDPEIEMPDPEVAS